MCGILGTYNYLDKEKFSSSLEKLHHRGPDSYGILFLNEKCFFGHKRLSILDLTKNGNQPMLDSSKRYSIIYNGEVYNFKELRLEVSEYPFQSNSDTEVLLALFIKFGEKMVEKLRGVFAFSIYDAKKDEIYLFRDRLGVKPLYYYYENKQLIFSSEISPIKDLAVKRLTPDYNGYYSFFNLGSVINPLTFFKEIKMLPPGHTIKFSENSIKLKKYFSINYNENNYTYKENVEKTIEILNQSVKYRLVSDLPVGAFLSGGVDSSAIVALMRQHKADEIKTFSIDFENKAFSEGNIAKQVAEKYETDHTNFLVTADDFKKEFYNILDSIDSPSIDGINTYFVSKLAKDKGITVVMSGLGGDEVFGGYNSFETFSKIKYFKQLLQFIPKSIFKNLNNLTENIKLQRILEYLSSKNNPNIDTYLFQRNLFTENQIKNFTLKTNESNYLNTFFEKEFFEMDFINDENIVSYFNTKFYMCDQLLRDSDIMSMRHSLELRVPLVDHKLVEFGASIPGQYKNNKMVLLDAVKSLLPVDVYNRRKKGFGFPLGEWMKRKDISPIIKDLFFVKSDYLDNVQLEIMWDNFMAGNLSYTRIWSIVVFNYYLFKNKL